MTISAFPEIGTRVMAKRESGKMFIARRDRKPDAIFRDPESVQWLSDDDKFIDIKMDPVVEWWYDAALMY